MSNKYDDDLKNQVLEIMKEEEAREKQRRTPQNTRTSTSRAVTTKKRKSVKKKKHKVLKTLGILSAALLVVVLILVGTKPGRSLLYKAAGNFIYKNTNNEDVIQEYEEPVEIVHADGSHREDYVSNYLIFGIEEFGGARNTDSMMIATVNTRDNTLKLTSLLRDSYVEIPGHNANKLNSAYSRGGVSMLIETIEMNYKIQIDGYMSVNFKSFEKIVDRLGGVDIELGKEEAKYLNTTNYISQKKYRNVKEGMNHLNGNQALGYVRVRKVKTLGGVNNDYGRIVRQQRVLKAIFESYKSPKNLIKFVSITKECLGYVSTNLTQRQIENLMSNVVENNITSLDTFRVPYDGAFDAPKAYNGITYPIVLDWDKNLLELYKFVFAYTEEEAVAALSR